MTRIVGFFAVLVLLSGCSQMHSYSNRVLPPVFEGGQGVSDWLGDLHNTRGLTASELQQVLETLDQAYREDPGINNRVRLALMLAAGDIAVRDPARARELLDGIDTVTNGPGEQELITILRQFLAQHEEDNENISELSKQVKQQGRRIKELEQQQRALTTIEQSIQQREKSAGE